MRTRSLAVAVVLALFLAGGCGSQEGETVFTAGPTNPDVAGKAPRDGTYTLYTALSPNPTLTVNLKTGDPVGFRKTDDGRIQAFAGTQTYTFDKATAQVYWKVR